MALDFLSRKIVMETKYTFKRLNVLAKTTLSCFERYLNSNCELNAYTDIDTLKIHT